MARLKLGAMAPGRFSVAMDDPRWLFARLQQRVKSAVALFCKVGHRSLAVELYYSIRFADNARLFDPAKP